MVHWAIGTWDLDNKFWLNKLNNELYQGDITMKTILEHQYIYMDMDQILDI